MYGCGLNSPFIGHEVNLAGLPNDDDVVLLGAQITRATAARRRR